MTDLTLAQLQKQVTDIANRTARRGEAIRILAQQIDTEARDTGRIADGIGAMGVDNETISECHDLARTVAGLSDRTLAYAAKSTDTAAAARAAHDQAHASHAGIREQFRAAPVDTRDLDTRWLTQE
ncbi:hypothetical protein AB0L55_39075 [Streptomyces anthocyanicus]|uniref:hypothetical protein n=1 Tax=Streptomyces anthocyanicus TaxID=68174 RepID=UPI00343E7B30